MAEKSIRMMCPNLKCKAVLSVPDRARGKSVQCKQCGMRIKIPGGSAAKSSAKPS